jgi:hypothetical protein
MNQKVEDLFEDFFKDLVRQSHGVLNDNNDGFHLDIMGILYQEASDVKWSWETCGAKHKAGN